VIDRPFLTTSLLLLIPLAWGCSPSDWSGSKARKRELLAAAHQAQTRDDSKAAIEHLERAREIDPRDGEVLGKLGLALAASGREEKAYQTLKEAVDRQPTGATLLAYGRLLCRRKAYREAKEVLKKALRLTKEKGPVLLELGVAQWMSNEVREAEDSLTQAVAEVGDSFAARFHLGEIHRQNRSYEKAQEELAAALRLSPDNPYAEFALAETVFALGDTATARDLYRKVVAHNQPFPRLGRVYFQLAQIAHQRREYQQALGYLGLARETGYDRELVSLWEARMALGMDQPARARSLLTPLLEKVDALPQSVYLMGRVELAQGHPTQALPHLQRALALPLVKEDIWASLGLCHLALLDAGEDSTLHVTKALEYFTRSLKKRPRHREALLGIARILIRYHVDLALASVHLRTVLEMSSSDQDALVLLASVLARQQKLAEALEKTTTALSADPKNPRLHFLMAALLLSSSRAREAEESTVNGLKIEAVDLYGRLVLTAVYSRTGRTSLARSCLRELMQPNSGSRLASLGTPVYDAISAVLGPARPSTFENPRIPFAERLVRAQEALSRVKAKHLPQQDLQSLEILRGLVEDFAVLQLSKRKATSAEADRQETLRLLSVKG